MIKPFIKWVGGKGLLLPQMEPYIPTRIQTYVEPFTGGGSVLLHILQTRKPSKVIARDLNPDLINLYVQVRDQVEGLIPMIENLKAQHLALSGEEREAFYYKIRSQHHLQVELERAARFLYLNKTCFNGLYRLNRKGENNVSFGQHAHPKIYDAEHLRGASEVIQGVQFEVASYAKLTEDNLSEGDFVYADPPYIPLSASSNFTSYTAEGFKDADQVALRDILYSLPCKWAASNSSSQRVAELYSVVNLHQIMAARNINSKGDGRGKVAEYLAVK